MRSLLWLLAGTTVLLVFPGVRRVIANAAVAIAVFVALLIGGAVLGGDAALVLPMAFGGAVVALLLRRRYGAAPVVRSAMHPLEAHEPEPEPHFAPPPFADDPAWRGFRERLGPSEGTRADRALADMAALLGEAAGRSPIDPASEHARRIERDVPEFLGIALTRCERATPAEARRYLTVALNKVEAIATKARAERERLRAADDAGFHSYSSYLDQTSAKRDE